ncbi:MAG: regulatory iron-sulfur-containing complex subunit RicT [Pirellulales bacterium]
MARYVVRYGVMRMVGVFSSRGDNLRRGTRVIARTNRGLEAGEVLCEATEQALAQLVDPPSGQVLREMTQEDQNEFEHLKSREKDEFAACQRHVEQLKLQMQLVDIEHLFGGERIVVYYLAEERVDFRDLVKALAGEFQTRIEMRQIGVRDEAKLLADYGDCGKPVCCNTHLIEMPPVSMKMAKLQKATLDPTKISGRCGRLKCCLRYEYDTYEELLKTLPPIGSEVVTTTGRARILNHEILTQQLLVQTEDNRRLMMPVSDVLTVLHTGRGRSQERGDRSDRSNRGDRGERSDRPEGDGGEATDASSGGAAGERRERQGGRPGDRRDERGGRGERGERSGRPEGRPDARRDRDRGPRRDRAARPESGPGAGAPPLDGASSENAPSENAPASESPANAARNSDTPSSAAPSSDAPPGATPDRSEGRTDQPLPDPPTNPPRDAPRE